MRHVSLRGDFMFNLGRMVDFNYKTNKIIAIVSIVVAAIGWILTGNVLSGLYIGLGAFLTWALSRELDPKHDYSAFLAVLFSLLNMFYYEDIQLLEIFWILLLMRITSGITGKGLTIFDIFSVLGFTIYLSLNNKNSVYLIVFILAMAFIIKVKEKKRETLIAGGIGLGFFIAESFFMRYLAFNNLDYLNSIGIFAIITLCVSFILFWFLAKDEIIDDLGNGVKRFRIGASQILYSVAVLLLFFLGNISMNNLVIYLSVIVGVMIFFIGFKGLNRKKLQ